MGDIHISPRKSTPAKHQQLHINRNPQAVKHVHQERHNTLNKNEYSHFQMIMADFYTVIFGLMGLITYFFSAANSPMSVHYAFFQNFSQHITPKLLIILLLILYGVTIFLHVNKNIENQWLQLIDICVLTLSLPYLLAFKSSGTSTSALVLFGLAFSCYYLAFAKQKNWPDDLKHNLIGLAPGFIICLIFKFAFRGTWTSILLTLIFTAGLILLVTFGADHFKKYSFTEMSLKNIVNFLYYAPYYGLLYIFLTGKNLLKR